ncbi:MAG: sulfite exporter TauE/SafE family protein [Candidatus Omnitrophica bacterium]|nr:sulfite exporter TauE/SafE family protein [Candidatus Omnitrophota bacterium]
MGVLDLILRFTAGGLIGFTIGLTGIGGGVLVMPALIVLFKIPPSVSIGTASLYALLTKIYATFEHLKHKTVNLTTGIFFLIGAIPTNIIVSYLINDYIKQTTDTLKIAQFQGCLKKGVIYILIISVVLLISQMIKSKKTDQKALSKIGGIISGAVIGAVIGATSIGGGVLIIPLLIICFNLSAKETVGTSIFIAVILVFITSIIYGKGGQIDYWTSITMAAGSIPGVFWGSKLCVKISEKKLKLIITFIILIATTMMIFNNSGH